MSWDKMLAEAKERREKQSIYLVIDEGDKSLIRILDSKNDTHLRHDHWIEKANQFVTCRSSEGLCPADEADDARIRRTTPVLLMNVWVYDEKRVRLLQLRGGDYWDFVSVAEEDEDINLRDYMVKGLEPTGKSKRAKVRLTPVDMVKSREKEIPEDVKKETLTDYFIVPDEDYTKKVMKGQK